MHGMMVIITQVTRLTLMRMVICGMSVRTDDVIKSSGYRIGPFEIENEIMKLPYVLECAVTSVPDPIRGQAIKASIVLANGEEGTDKLRNEIMKSLKKNIASYKWSKNT